VCRIYSLSVSLTVSLFSYAIFEASHIRFAQDLLHKTDFDAGPFQCILETTTSISLAFGINAALGYNDGMCLKFFLYFCSFLRSLNQTVQGLVHNFGGLMGEY
jgi:hypothetical protein